MAALNKVYLSTLSSSAHPSSFRGLEVAPPDLAARFESLFGLDERAPTAELERLVGETHALVAEHLSDIELALGWAGTHTSREARGARMSGSLPDPLVSHQASSF